MSKMRITGLVLIGLAIVMCFVFQIARDYHRFFLLPVDRTGIITRALGFAVPIYLALALSLLWPRRGAIVAVALSIGAMLISTLAIVTAYQWSMLNSTSGLVELLKEVGIWVGPYFVSLVGSLLVYFSVRRINPSSTTLSESNVALPPAKLRKAGLILIFLAASAQTVFYVWLALETGDSVWWGNVMTGIIVGGLYTGPIFLMGIVAWKSPFYGGIFTVAGSLALISLAISTLLGPGALQIFGVVNLMGAIVSLTGGMLVLISALKAKATGMYSG